MALIMFGCVCVCVQTNYCLPFVLGTTIITVSFVILGYCLSLLNPKKQPCFIPEIIIYPLFQLFYNTMKNKPGSRPVRSRLTLRGKQQGNNLISAQILQDYPQICVFQMFFSTKLLISHCLSGQERLAIHVSILLSW